MPNKQFISKSRIILTLAFLSFSFILQAQNADSAIIRRIFSEALTRGTCYSTLDYLSNKIGGRLSGSEQAENAVRYMFDIMKGQGFDSVWLQPVMVPHWIRGEKEEAYLISGNQKEVLSICALGNSVGTGIKGIEAGVIEVHDFNELASLGKEKINGKIVFFNRPFPDDVINAFEAYRLSVNQRTIGAIQAARYGAKGVIVRSMTHSLDNLPHTGAMAYRDTVLKIPACAISTIGANRLSQKIKEDPNTHVYFRQTCEMLPDIQSYNVIGELKGKEKPDEIIVIGGHLDSWDTGKGAQDDGAGIVQSVEVLRIIRSLGNRPRRTIRAVLFMNEENGLKGGKKYAEEALSLNQKHIAAIESDAGGFMPRSFHTSAMGDTLTYIKQWEKLLKPYHIVEIGMGGGGSDIEGLQQQGTVLFSFVPDGQRYFDYHHSASDTFDKVNKRELELGAACITALSWLLSEYGVR